MVISQEKNECWSCHVTFGLTTKAWRYVTLVEVEVREGERESIQAYFYGAWAAREPSKESFSTNEGEDEDGGHETKKMIAR